MTTVTIRTAITDPGPLSSYLVPGDVFRITPSGSYIANRSGFTAVGGDVDFLIAGRLEMGRSAISTAAMSLGQVSNTIRVAETGVVKGDAAIDIQSSTTLVNAGTIGGATGIRFSNYTQVATEVEITNIGRIETTGYAIYGSGSLMTVTITNLGTIVGVVSLLGNASYTLHNSGRIEGRVGFGEAADTVVNKGVFTNVVYLQGGADVFDDSAGTGPLGLDLGAGDDLAKLGRAAETVTGGDGLDVVSYEAARARVVLNLADGARNTGAALGDQFDGVEVFRGSAWGDVMAGDAGANRLEGLAGDDRLVGAAGDDTLVGGAGADQLRGGLGVDVFVFDGVGADRVLDFRGDVLGLVGTAFGLEAGALAASAVAVRAGHVAQGSERVLFDTTDKTLWVDVDGAGGADAVLVAQLQANAQLSAADILVL